MAHLTIENGLLKPNDEMIKKIEEFCKKVFKNEFKEENIELESLSDLRGDTEELKEFLKNKCVVKKPEPAPEPAPVKTSVEQKTVNNTSTQE